VNGDRKTGQTAVEAKLPRAAGVSSGDEKLGVDMAAVRGGSRRVADRGVDVCHDADAGGVATGRKESLN
jgi:hypothetical protein